MDSDTSRADLPPLPGTDSTAGSVALLVAGFAPSLLDLVVPPLGIPASILAIWLLLRAQGRTLAVVGVRRPDHGWGRTIAFGVGGALLLLLLGQFVYPLLRGVFGLPPQDISSYETIEGNRRMLAIFLGVSWTTAGFGEELIFRGFLMAGLARLLGRDGKAWATALVLSSAIFGLVHLRTGWGGVMTTGLNGAVLAGIYLASRRSIWAAYLAHALVDTVAFLVIYTGLYRTLPGLT